MTLLIRLPISPQLKMPVLHVLLPAIKLGLNGRTLKTSACLPACREFSFFRSRDATLKFGVAHVDYTAGGDAYEGTCLKYLNQTPRKLLLRSESAILGSLGDHIWMQRIGYHQGVASSCSPQHKTLQPPSASPSMWLIGGVNFVPFRWLRLMNGSPMTEYGHSGGHIYIYIYINSPNQNRIVWRGRANAAIMSLPTLLWWPPLC